MNSRGAGIEEEEEELPDDYGIREMLLQLLLLPLLHLPHHRPTPHIIITRVALLLLYLLCPSVPRPPLVIL